MTFIAKTSSFSKPTSSSLLVRSISFPFQILSWLVTVTLISLLQIMGNIWPSKPCEPSQVVHPTLVGRLPAPQKISQIDPELLLYTESSYTEYSLLINSSHSPEKAVQLIGEHLTKEANQNERLIILTHGFLTTKNVSWLHQLKDAILSINKEGVKQQVVLILGWGGGADIGLTAYPQAAANALEVGRWLATILTELRKVYPPTRLQTYAIGHSLGAHLLGAAGRNSGKALDRITGLDPAGVGFQTEENEQHRLSKSDARLLVDVIHTDGQDVPYFGTLVPMGTIDFYPNYGWNQPTKDRVRDVKPDQSTEVEIINSNSDESKSNIKGQKRRKIPKPSPYGSQISESHSRAIELYCWSVGNGRAFRTNLRLDGVPAVECAVHRVIATGQQGDAEVCVEMGYYTDEYMDGQLAEGSLAPGQCIIKPRDTNDDNQGSEENSNPASKYDDFAGCYYVHTNATPSWS